MDEDSTVYRNMNGPTEFHVIGTMKDWTIENRLDRIEAPTLLISGQYDYPIRIVVFNAVVGWSRDATEDIAEALAERAAHEPLDLGP